MRTTILLAAAAALCACGASRPVASGAPGAICPAGIQPTLTSIDQQLLKVTCTECHSGSLAASSGGLDLSGNAFGVLVGVTAQNIGATSRPSGLLRVDPGNPDDSLLYQKLLIEATPSPQFGAGMPLNDPGAVCQATRDAVRQWIANGAQND